MITPTVEILREVLEDTDELIEYVLSSSGDPNLPKWLTDIKTKVAVAYGRLSSPVEQQETKKHIPEDPFKKNSNFEDFTALVRAGKLPPIGESKFGIQYIE